MSSRGSAISMLAMAVAISIPIYAASQSDQTTSQPNHKYNPRNMASTYVPLDSWIYPALDRLTALGDMDKGFEGMRPWTRMECARMIYTAREALKLFRSSGPAAEDLLERLEEEFSFELSLQDGQRNLNASLESAYARAVSISGPALTNSYHFGQTVSYDFGRPFERGMNGQAGAAFRADAGPFALYLRAEYQHAPSAPAPSQSVLNVIALKDEIPTPPDVAISGINRPRLLDAYVVLNLSPLKLSNWQLSVGRQSHSWGPGLGGSLLISDNAEPVAMVEVVNPEPIRLQLFLKFLGPVKIDQFLGRLAGRTDHPNPWIYGQKITFQPFSCLEIGYGRTTTLGGRGGDPFTLHNLVFSMFGQSSGAEPGDSIPGENNNEMDWTFYLPKVRRYVVFYGEVYAYDDFIAWIYPPSYPFRPGVYITRIPGIPKLDLHVEAASTETPGWHVASGGNVGQSVYWNYGYHEANTNDGFLMGNTVGRDGQTIQGWLTYWASPRNTFQLMYKNNFVAPTFIPGGGEWQDYSLQNEIHRRSGLYGKSQLQYEHISHYPLLLNGRRHNVTAIVELGFTPGNSKYKQ
jgi:hypothetical protein